MSDFFDHGSAINLIVLNQSIWYIDPANVTRFASDSNDGYTQNTPLLTFTELNKRWMRGSLANNVCYFQLLQDTLVTFLSLPLDPYSDSINLDIERIGSYNLTFAYAAPTSRTGIFSAITTRSANQWWQVTGGIIPSDVNSLIINTTRNTAAWVIAQTSGVADTTEWTTAASTANKTVAIPTIVSSQVGDNYAIKNLCRIHVGHINIRPTSTLGSPPRISPISFFHFQFASDAIGQGLPDELQINALNGAQGAGASFLGVNFTECSFEGKLNITNAGCYFYNCNVQNFMCLLTAQGVVLGGRQVSIGGNASYCIVDGYPVFTGQVAISDSDFPTSNLFEISCVMLYNTQDAFYGAVRSRFVILPSFYNGGLPEIVGKTTQYMFRMSGGSLVLIHNSSGTWTNACKASTGPHFASLDGGIIAGCTVAVSFNQTTLTMGNTAIEVNPVNLDLAIGSGGFGGWAVHPGTLTSFRHFNE